MTSSNYQFIKWQEIRKQGFVRFVLIRVALGWGIVTAILYSLLMWVFSETDMSRLLPISLVIFPIGGLLGGAFMWWFSDRKHKQNVSVGDS